jgi:hypothetical protein
MTAIHLGDVVPALDNPEPTAVKRGRQLHALRANPSGPLSKASLEAEHGPESAYRPRWHTGSFRAPLGMRGPAFSTLCADQARAWLNEMQRRGFDIVSDTQVDIQPGPYPAKDLITGLLLLGEREMLIRAQFRERQPTVERIELPRELFAENSG